MYIDKFPSEPTDYFDIDDDGNVVPPHYENKVQNEEYDDLDDTLEDDIKNATQRQVGQIAVQTEDMSDEERLRGMREEREDDRRGTHPGSSRELTTDEKELSRKAEKERRETQKKHKKINDAIRKINTINPNSIDPSLAKELRQARDFLRKNGVDPQDHLPDYWKNN